MCFPWLIFLLPFEDFVYLHEGWGVSRFGMRKWGGLLSAALILGMLPANSAAAISADKGPKLPRPKQPPTVAVKHMAVGGTDERPDAARPWKAPKVIWPAPGRATVQLKTTAGDSKPRKAG